MAILVYAGLAMRRVYDDGALAAAINAVFLLVIFIGVTHAFRLLLFLVTYWSVG